MFWQKVKFILPFAVNVMLNLPIINTADIRTKLCLRNFVIDDIFSHSKIMYSVFLFGIWNCVKERNRILALPKTTNSFKNLGFSAFILQVLQSKRSNGLFCVYSECTCDV